MECGQIQIQKWHTGQQLDVLECQPERGRGREGEREREREREKGRHMYMCTCSLIIILSNLAILSRYFPTEEPQ